MGDPAFSRAVGCAHHPRRSRIGAPGGRGGRLNRFLPDVNVLLAIAWPNHQFHAPAKTWLQTITAHGVWMTCALTQLGFIRISSNPAFTKHAATPAEASLLMDRLSKHTRHRFLSALPSCMTTEAGSAFQRALGHRQVTDAYLVALARGHKLRLVTFDRRIAALSGPGGDNPLVLSQDL